MMSLVTLSFYCHSTPAQIFIFPGHTFDTSEPLYNYGITVHVILPVDFMVHEPLLVH